MSENKKGWKKAIEDIKVHLGPEGQLRRRRIRSEVT